MEFLFFLVGIVLLAAVLFRARSRVVSVGGAPQVFHGGEPDLPLALGQTSSVSGMVCHDFSGAFGVGTLESRGLV